MHDPSNVPNVLRIVLGLAAAKISDLKSDPKTSATQIELFLRVYDIFLVDSCYDWVESVDELISFHRRIHSHDQKNNYAEQTPKQCALF